MLDHLDLSAVRAVAVDVDGTLAGPDSRVSDRTIRALRAVSALDLPVILLTGRTRRNAMEISRQADLPHLAVACNGALVFDPVTDEDLLVTPMSQADKQTFRELAEDLGMDLTWWTRNQMYVASEGPMRDTIRVLNGEEAEIGDLADLDGTVVLKMMAWASSDRMDEVTGEIHRRLPGSQRSMDDIVEAVDQDSTKWHALEWVLRRYDIAPDDVLGAGDGGNDVGWLSRIGFPVAMGNARPEVLQVARGVAPSNADDGAAHLLERLAAAHGA
ncbi:MAG: HAD family hydrolase [Micropruina sp.]|uniref:HAD family hydrolase n=1 Tax=Micropruina sp. TaxID=2737536 RepID=UPI0039E41DB6